MLNLTDIPGITALWRRTQGDSRIKIAILDVPADLGTCLFCWDYAIHLFCEFRLFCSLRLFRVRSILRQNSNPKRQNLWLRFAHQIRSFRLLKSRLWPLRPCTLKGELLDNPPDKITFAINKPSLANAEITLSSETFQLVTEILKTISKGHPVIILPLQAELSTQEAADILNVSRPYVVKLLDSGTIPSRKVGVYRRILASDVLQYKQQNEAARHQALDELTGTGT